MHPEKECTGQEQYYIRSSCHLNNLWVRLTISQMYLPEEASSGTKLGPVDLSSDVPPVEASTSQECYYVGFVDLSSDLPPSRDI